MATDKRLEIRVLSRQILLDEKPVPLTEQFFNLYCFLALSRLERQEEEGFVEAIEITLIRDWEDNSPLSVGKQISRHLQETEVPGLIEAVQKTKGPYRLKLSPEDIQFDASLDKVQSLLGLSDFEDLLTDSEEQDFSNFIQDFLKAQSYMDLGRLQKALSSFQKARQSAINPQQVAFSMLQEGRILERLGKYADAEALYREVYEFSGKIPGFRTWARATSLTYLAWLYYRRHELKQAEKIYEQVLSLVRAKGYYRILGDVYNGMAQISVYRNQTDRSVAFYQRALEYWALTGYTYGIQAIYYNLGQIYFNRAKEAESRGKLEGARLRYEKAKEWIERCIEITEELEIAFDTTADRIRLAEVYFRLNRTEEALEHARKANENAKRSGNVRDVILSYWVLLQVQGAMPDSRAHTRILSEIAKLVADRDFRSVFRSEAKRAGKEEIARIVEDELQDEAEKQPSNKN